MKVLVREAARRGFSLKELASALQPARHPESLSRSILAEKPLPDTIGKIVSALGYRTIVAAALLDRLKASDAPECRRVILDAIRKDGYVPLRGGEHGLALRNNLLELLELKEQAALEAGRACVLARAGLDEVLDGGPADDPMLGRILGAIERVLGKYNLSLKNMIAPEALQRKRAMEGCAAYLWLNQVVAIPETVAEEMREIIEPSVDKVQFTDHEKQRVGRSIGAARRAFFETLYAKDAYTEGMLARAIANLAPPQKGKTP